MAKSFCSGCKHWKWVQHEFKDGGFHYCDKYSDQSLRWRSLVCNGMYYEKEE